MAEQQFREIQLSGKQLVFLFMTSVALAVGVFLLGVSVGRGVGPDVAGVTEVIADAAAVSPPAELPPPTELSPADTAYHDNLQGSRTPPAEPEPEPEPISEPVPDEDEPVAPRPALVETRPTPPATPPAAQRPAPQPAPAAAPPTSTAKPAATSTATANGWYLQVGAYRSRENADRQARQLSGRGFATSVAPPVAGGLFRVRVGPFADRAEAVRVQGRLRSQEGLASSLTR
jgi:cell division protein FtsN